MYHSCSFHVTEMNLNFAYQVKLDDGAEWNLTDFRMHVPERAAVSLQSFDDSKQGPIDGRTCNFSAQDSFFARCRSRFLAFSVVDEFGVVAENGYAGEVLPGRRAEVEGDGGRALGSGVDLADVVVQPDVSHGGLVLGQGSGLVAKKNRC